MASQNPVKNQKRLSTATGATFSNKITLIRPQTATVASALASDELRKNHLGFVKHIDENLFSFNLKAADSKVKFIPNFKKNAKFSEVAIEPAKQIQPRHTPFSFGTIHTPNSFQGGLSPANLGTQHCVGILRTQKGATLLHSNPDKEFYLSAPTPSVPLRSYGSDYNLLKSRKASVRAISTTICKESLEIQIKNTLTSNQNSKENTTYQGLGPNFTDEWLSKSPN